MCCFEIAVDHPVPGAHLFIGLPIVRRLHFLVTMFKSGAVGHG